MTATRQLDRLLEQARQALHDGRLAPGVLIDLLTEATDTSVLELAERLTAARQAALRTDPDRQADRHQDWPRSCAVASAARYRALDLAK